MGKEELKKILDNHKKWILNEDGGERLDLRGADLRGASLCGADLRYANLCDANLCGADIYGAKFEDKIMNKFYPICCPEIGSFTAWKKCGEYIVKLQIIESAKRSSAFGRECRCDKAMCVEIQNIDGTKSDALTVASNYDSNFVYEVGNVVSVDNFDDNRWNECAPGIHFFITRQEAVDY